MSSRSHLFAVTAGFTLPGLLFSVLGEEGPSILGCKRPLIEFKIGTLGCFFLQDSVRTPVYYWGGERDNMSFGRRGDVSEPSSKEERFDFDSA